MFKKLADKLRENEGTQEIDFHQFTESTSPLQMNTDADAGDKVSSEITAGGAGASGNLELKVVRPESFGEVAQVADYLLDGCTVVLNVEALDRPSTLRMLDFLNGVTYCLDGEIKKAAPTTYLVTAHNVDVSDEV